MTKNLMPRRREVTESSGNKEIRTIVTHQATGVASMKYPCDGLGKAVSRVDDTRDVYHVNVASSLPFLNGEVLNVNVTRTRRGTTGVDHLDGRFVIFIERCRTILRKTELAKDRTKVLGNFGSFDGGEKFGLGTGGSSYGLGVAAVGDDTSSKQKAVTGGGATIAKIIGVRGIDEATKVEGRRAGGKRRKKSIKFDK